MRQRGSEAVLQTQSTAQALHRQYRVRGSESRTDLCLQDLTWTVDQLVELAGDLIALGSVEVDGAEYGAEERELHGEH